MKDLAGVKIGVIGLGYVGLPLAVELGKRYPTVGFDIKPDRIDELVAGRDSTREVSAEELELLGAPEAIAAAPGHDYPPGGGHAASRPKSIRPIWVRTALETCTSTVLPTAFDARSITTIVPSSR